MKALQTATRLIQEKRGRISYREACCYMPVIHWNRLVGKGLIKCVGEYYTL